MYRIAVAFLKSLFPGQQTITMIGPKQIREVKPVTQEGPGVRPSQLLYAFILTVICNFP